MGLEPEPNACQRTDSGYARDFCFVELRSNALLRQPGTATGDGGHATNLQNSRAAQCVEVSEFDQKALVCTDDLLL